MTAAKLRLAMAAMGKPETKIGELCAELGISASDALPACGPGRVDCGRTGGSCYGSKGRDFGSA